MPPTTALFSPSSNHRHSSLSQSLGLSATGPVQGTLPSLSGAHSFAPSISSMAVAAAGDSLRPALLDESALSPAEYGAYMPALLSLKRSEADIDGLYDEQSALLYLREKCKLQLKDEALVLSLFERTPLGIKPGHFFAWLRLVSWVQQGHQPSKKLLFTQTQPAQTFIGALSIRSKHGGSTTNSPLASTMPAMSDSGKQAGYGTQHAHHASAASSAAAPSVPVHPVSLADVAETSERAPTAKVKSRKASHHSHTNVSAPRPAHKSKNPFRNMSRAASNAQHVESANGSGPSVPAHHAHEVPRLEAPKPTQYHRPSPLIPAHAPPYHAPPAPSSISSARTLPLDALIGQHPAPNPFKPSKPRLVRPTPVVAGPRRSVSHAHAPEAELRVEREWGVRSPSPGWPLEDTNTCAGFKFGDHLAAPMPSRAPISPLIQAGLNAASEVQRAKQSLPPKTYTTIQRSTQNTMHGPKSKAKPSPSSKKVASQRSVSGPVTSAPTLVAPQPRRAAADQDLTARKKSTSRTEYDEEDLHSTRSLKSTKRSHRLEPNVGDLLGSHLASLGAGGRPKSRGTLTKRPEELHPDSTAGSVQNWLRDQDALAHPDPMTPATEDPRRSSMSSVSASMDEGDDPMVDVASGIRRPGNPFDARQEEPRPPPSSLVRLRSPLARA